MKTLCVMAFLVSVFAGGVTAQTEMPNDQPRSVKPFEIAICYNKTTSLIFPYSIKSVDRGSAAVLVQKAKGLENILQIKAGKKEFTPTNLSVVTADGKFYSFSLFYENEPKDLSIYFGENITSQLSLPHTNQQQLEKEKYAVNVQPSMRLKKMTDSGIDIILDGIFFSDQNLWFKFHVLNKSPIEFNPEYIRFFLVDRKRAKRTAIQETELSPIYSEVPENIRHNSDDYVVMAFRSFFIPEGKNLVVQVGEKYNGRMISMRIKQKLLLKGVRLAD